MDLLFYLTIIFFSLIAIVITCTIFTNAIEHLGEHLNLSNRTMGSIFAVIGTGLPETIVPLVAVLGAYIAGKNITLSQEIGIGAILGSPFMISTFAFFITGCFIYIFHKINKRTLDIKTSSAPILRDFKFFFIFYTVAVLASFIKFPYSKFLFGIILLIGYIIYIYRTIKTDKNDEEKEETPLYFQICPTNLIVHNIFLTLQIIISLIGIIYFSHLFVKSLTYFANITNIQPMILSLFLAPIATEMPEIINSIIWVRNSKDNLAMANLSGAIVYQSSILTAIGIFLTDWSLNFDALINIFLVYLSIITLYGLISKYQNKKPFKIFILNGFYWLIYVIYVIFMKG